MVKLLDNKYANYSQPRACAFVMYILPNAPFILTSDWVEPLCAFVYISSDLSDEVEKRESQTMVETIFAFINWYSKILVTPAEGKA